MSQYLDNSPVEFPLEVLMVGNDVAIATRDNETVLVLTLAEAHHLGRLLSAMRKRVK